MKSQDPKDLLRAQSRASFIMPKHDHNNFNLGQESFLSDSWNNFKYHLQWHKALMLIDNQMEDKVLKFYDNSILNIKSDEYLDLTNNISLLL